MSYFRELPDLDYQSPSSDKISSQDYVRVKNLFRRVKLREDLQNVFTIFNKYQIPEGARPDTVAEGLYGSATYDWVVLLSGGITNVKDQWPLSDRDVSAFAEQKYGLEKLNDIRYYETIEVKDSSGRLILPAGKVVDKFFSVPLPAENIDAEFDSIITKINNDTRTASGQLIYAQNSNEITTTNLYGTFTVTPNGTAYDWSYTFNPDIIELLNFNEGFADAVDSISYLSIDGYRRTISVKTKVTINPDEYPISYSYDLSIIKFSGAVSYITYYDTKLEREVTQYDITRGITNYEYEILKNNKKRSIYLLKPIYLQQYVNDLRQIMIYDRSSQYVSRNLIRTENTAVTLP